jgi:hypothetical protein
LIEKTIESDSISGKLVIESLCELNGCFGHINRQGNWTYIFLSGRIDDALFPSITLFPSDYLYPRDVTYADDHDVIISKGKYKSCKYEDFETLYISDVQIRKESGDVGETVSSETIGVGRVKSNIYVVENNFLVYGKDSNDLYIVGTNLISSIFEVTYRPFECELRGNMCLEVGDLVEIKTKTRNIHSYVLKRELKGIKSMIDVRSSSGVYQYTHNPNSTSGQLKQLRGKTNVLQRTVENTISEIKNLENETSTRFEQTAEQLSLKVTSGEVISEINASAEGVKIAGEKISLEGTVTANEYF